MRRPHSRSFGVCVITNLMGNVYLIIADFAIQFAWNVNFRRPRRRLVSGRLAFNDLLIANLLISAEIGLLSRRT